MSRALKASLVNRLMLATQTTGAPSPQQWQALADELGLFGLRAFPGRGFKLSAAHCYDAQAYTYVHQASGWQSFGKSTLYELAEQITEVPPSYVETLLDAAELALSDVARAARSPLTVELVRVARTAMEAAAKVEKLA